MAYNSKQETATILELHHEDYSLYVTAPAQSGMYQKAMRLVHSDALKIEYRWSADANLFIRRGLNEDAQLIPEGTSDENGCAVSQGQQAVFFENTEYQFEIDFHADVRFAELRIPEFRNDKGVIERRDSYMSRRKMLSFMINYGNEIGQTDIVVDYTLTNGECRRFALHYDVLSSKLDYHKDLKVILNDIEREYSMLSLSFLRKTYHTFNTDINAHETPDIIWWNIFKGIQQEFCRSVAMVIDRPHNRLKRVQKPLRSDRLKRITPSIEAELIEHQGEDNHLYLSEHWQLNDDTIENRFMKFALYQITEKFLSLSRRIYDKNKASLPKQYALELQETEDTLRRLGASPFLRRIGRFTGLKGENLTLKQATGYSTIYRDWLLLQNTYDLHDGVSKMELKDISELYEIWCFIEVKNIVRQLLAEHNGLGVDDIDQLIPTSSMSFAGITPDMILRLNRGEESKVLLRLGNTELAEVIYNAQLAQSEDANKKSGMGEHVGSMTVPQRPDIVLRLSKEDVAKGIEMTYLFDAKYQLESKGTLQVPPDDAINQMHRYRDAIYYSQTAYKRGHDGKHEFKREVLGGYILFPGLEPSEPEKVNYLNSIGKVNIGAFPLRPSADGAKDRFLRHFLAEIIGKPATETLLTSIPQRGLRYAEDKPASPILLIGFARDENMDKIRQNRLYYIPAVKEDRNFEALVNFDKIEYVLVHTDKGGRQMFRLDGKPEFISGKKIRELGFKTKAKDSDMYIGYKLKLEFAMPSGFDIDIDSVRISKQLLNPHIRTLANPHVY